MTCPQKAIFPSAIRKIKPNVKVANTWDEIALWMGADPVVLKATIDEYNDACNHGHDASFGKDRKYLKPLIKPPYYALKCSVSLVVSLGGIRINEQMQAVDKYDRLILGLFIAGNDAGGWESDTYCDLLSGSTFGFAINSGRIAGENAARYILAKSTQYGHF
jgi:fumarate reductase flavoprotein subunit